MASQLDSLGVQRVSAYDSQTGSYQTYVMGYTPVDMPIGDDYAYFLDCSGNTALMLYGDEFASPHNVVLNAGWNAIAWCSLSTARVSDLCGRSAAIQRVCRYNNTAGAYDTYVAGFSGEDKNFAIEPGEGYFIYLSSGPVQINIGGI